MGLRSLIKRGVKEAAKATPAGQALTALDALKGIRRDKNVSGAATGEMIHLIRDLLTDDDGLVAQVEDLKESIRNIRGLLISGDNSLTEQVIDLQARVSKLEGGQ